MQTNITIKMDQNANFFTSMIDSNGEETYIPTDFELLDNINTNQPWVMMTKTITQYKYNKCGIMGNTIVDMLKYVKEELDYTADIWVMCYKPEITVFFFKE